MDRWELGRRFSVLCLQYCAAISRCTTAADHLQHDRHCDREQLHNRIKDGRCERQSNGLSTSARRWLALFPLKLDQSHRSWCSLVD